MRASLQAEYGLRLLPDGHGRTEPHRTPRELADLLEHLPPGCALFRVMGGPSALSNEAHLLRQVEFNQRDLFWQEAGATKTGQPRPDMIPLPKRAGEEDAAAAAVGAKARRWQARHARVTGAAEE